MVYYIWCNKCSNSLTSRLVNCGYILTQVIVVASTKSFTNTRIVLSLIGLYFNNKYNNIQKINSLRLLSNTINYMLYNNYIIKN